MPARSRHSAAATGSSDHSPAEHWKLSRLVVCGLALVALVAGIPGLPAAAQPWPEPLPELVPLAPSPPPLVEPEGLVTVRVRRGQVQVDGAETVAEAALAVGVHYAKTGELGQAREVFANGVERSPDSKPLLFDAAVVAMLLGNDEEALAYAKRAHDRDPEDWSAATLQGIALVRLARFEEGQRLLDAALVSAPDRSLALAALGRAELGLGDAAGALSRLERAREIDSQDPVTRLNLGVALQRAGRAREARQLYESAQTEAAIAAMPPIERSRIARNLGSLRQRTGEAGGAVTAYEASLELEPDQADLQFALGHLHEQLGQDEGALAAFTAAAVAPDRPPAARLRLGALQARLGNAKEAGRLLEEALPELDPVLRLGAQRLLAQVYVDTGQGDRAEAILRQTLADDPEDAATRLTLGRLLRRDGRLDEARATLEPALGGDAPGPEIRLELAAVAAAAGDLEAEERLYRELLEAGGTATLATRVSAQLALLLLRRGDAGEARTLLGEVAAASADGGSPFTPVELVRLRTGYALLVANTGDLAGARHELAGVLALDAYPPAVLADAALGTLTGGSIEPLAAAIATVRGTPLEAVGRGDYGQALWLASRDPAAREHLALAESQLDWPSVGLAIGTLHLAAGRNQAAVTSLEPAAAACTRGGTGALVRSLPAGLLWVEIAAGPSEPRCAAIARNLEQARLRLAREHLTDGSNRLRQGDDEGARRALEAALALDPPAADRPPLLNNLGIALANLGAAPEAQRRLEEALRSDTAGLAATLNLALLLDRVGQTTEARRLYEEYRRRRGPRTAEVEQWLAELPPATAAAATERATLVVHLPGAPIEAANRLAEAARGLGAALSALVPGLELEVQIFKRWQDAEAAVAAEPGREWLYLTDASVAPELAAKSGVTPMLRFVRAGKPTYRRLLVVRADRAELRDLGDAVGGKLTIVSTAGPGTVSYLERQVFESRPGLAEWLATATAVPDDFSATANVLYSGFDAALVAEYNPLSKDQLGKALRVVFSSPELSLPVLSLRRSSFSSEQLAAFSRVPDELTGNANGAAFLTALGLDGMRNVVSGRGPFDREALVGQPPPPPKAFEILPPPPAAPPPPPEPGSLELATFVLGVELPQLAPAGR